MKKAFQYFLIIWAVLLALFNVIAFVSVGWIGYEKYTAAFWTGYVFITLSFVGQLICGYFALREENARKMFYKFSLVTTSYTGLILSFVFGGLCMLISPLPYWVGILVCAILLAVNVMAVVKACAAVELVSEIDEKIQEKTFFIREITVDADTLMSRATGDAARSWSKQVYEALRYSDPMSHTALYSVEGDIRSCFGCFAEAVKADAPEAEALGKELLLLVEERNKKCKLLK